MNIRESIEAMKVLEPYAGAMVDAKTIGDAIRSFLRLASERNPIDALRLLSLMMHIDLEILAESMEKKSGGDFVALLATGFEVNPLDQLMLVGINLGILRMRVEDG